MALRRSISFLLLMMLAAPSLLVSAPRAGVPAERAVANRWLKGMTLREKVAQLVIVPCFGEDPGSESPEFQKFARWVRELKVGGFVVLNRVAGGTVRNAEPHAMASFLNRMQRLSKVPLIMAGDFERGSSMRVAGTAKFPHQMAYGAAHNLELTRQMGTFTARESRAMGIHWVFAPDSDVNNNPDNPIINTRSFGEDPADVARHVKAYIEGAHSDPKARVLVTAKHFPGHGDTNVDSHLAMPALTVDRARIESLELVPFRAALEAGVDTVMSAHLSVPALDPEGVPATVSAKVITDILRGELKFQGLAVTDAMDMQGLTKQFPGGEAAVRALEAGIDVLLIPPDPDVVINAVMAAVQDGRLTPKRIEESARKILEAKVRVGLDRQKLVNIEAITDVLENPELTDSAQKAAQAAVTLVRNEKGSVPLRDPASTCVWVLSEGRYGQGGRRFADELRRRSRAVKSVYLDPQVSGAEVEAQVRKNAPACSTQVVAVMAASGAYKAGGTLPGAYPVLMDALGKGSAPVVLVSIGSPYVVRLYPGAASYLTTFSSAPTAEAAAVRALFGDAPITGRMPVTIPGIAKPGDGIQVEALARTAVAQ